MKMVLSSTWTLFVSWSCFLLTGTVAQFSEETFYKTCSSPSGILCFGISLLDPLNPKCNKNCDLAVSIFEDKKNLGKVRFQLWGKPQKDPLYNGSYIAVALSNDEEMGDDSVVECVSTGNKPSPRIFTSWNYGRQHNERQNDKSYISREWASLKDKTIYCDFTRDAISKVKQKTFNLKTGPGYHILLAMGNAEPYTDRIRIHSTRIGSEYPILTPDKIVIHEPPHYVPSPSGALLMKPAFLLFLLLGIIKMVQ